MKRFLLLVALFSLTYLLNAQTTSVITGRVLDTDNLPLPGANVTIEGTDNGTVSDVNGFYTLVQVPVGSQKVHVSYIGFTEETKEVVVSDGKTTELNFKLKPGIMLNEVEIGYQLQGQAKALNQQKSNDNVTNIVASDQVGKFPDANIGDAIKRIPGISVQYDQGEARFGHVRGTEPKYNSVSINGERIPSAEAEIRSVQLDLIPSDMIQTIEVSKTLTPDMDGDAIGGAINLVTRSAPSGTRVSATLGSGYNIISSSPSLTASVILGTRVANDKLGIIFSGSYFDNPLGSDNIEAEWVEDEDGGNGGNPFIEDFQIRQYEVQRIRQSYSLALDYKFNDNHMIEVSGIYNHRNDWENRFRTVYKSEYDEEDGWEYAIERQTKGGFSDTKSARLEDQRTMSGKLKGEHLFGNIKLNWSGSYAKASEERPQERYIQMLAEGGDLVITQDLSDPNKPMFSATPAYADLNDNYELDELTEENQYTDEIDMTAKLNLDIPLMTGQYKNSLKLGGKYKGKEKKRDNNFYEFNPIDEDAFLSSLLGNTIDKTKDNFLAGDYVVGNFIDNEYLGGLNLDDPNIFEKEADFSEYVGNYNASENVISAYAMFRQNFGSKFKATVGLRMEHTQLEAQGFSWNDDEEVLAETEKKDNSYTNILPNLQLKYDIDDNQILRFAYTNSLARPNYFALVPYMEIEDDGETVNIGNPDLIPTTSMNFDLMYENYFKSIGILSGGLFYKDISDFIIETKFNYDEYNGVENVDLTQTVNAGDATIFGIEASFQRQLDFLPGALKGLGIYTNYTYIKSKVTDFQLEGREDEDIALPGTPDHNFNGSLSWDYKGFNIRFSANWASAFRDSEGVGESAFYDRWYDQVLYLDVNAYYAFADHWKIFVDATNLTNQPLRYYQGQSDRVMQAEYYNARITAGVKFDLFVE